MTKKLLKFTSPTILFFGFLLLLLSILPLFRKEFFPMHDFSHVARLVELDQALKDGHFPARWAKDLGWGYGMPLFQFYAPLPYYISELFHLLGFSFLNAIKICFGLTFFLSFFSMYVFAKKFWGRWGGFLAALAFVYSPYRAVDFYVRGALGELFAIALIPLVLWAITEVIDKKNKKITALASLILALFLLSHTVLSLIGLPIFLLFTLFYFLINRTSAKALLRLSAAFGLGIGLSSFFLIPAFFEKKFSQIEHLISGYSHYSHHFLYFRQFIWGQWGYGGSVDGIEDGLSFHLGKTHLGLAAVVLVFALVNMVLKKNLKKRNLLTVFFAMVGAFLAFLSTYHAKPIWDAVPIMAFIQFPWRFNSVIIVLLAFLAGGAIYYLKNFSKQLSLFFLIAISTILIKTNYKYFRPEKYTDLSGNYYTDQARIAKSMSGTIPDYIPVWVKDLPYEPAEEEYEVISGEPKLETITDKTQKLFIKVSNSGPSRIRFNKFYFPGWKAYMDNDEVNFEYKKTNGLIVVDLPKGEYVFKLVLTKTFIQKMSELASLISLAAALFLFFGNRLRKKLIKGKI